MDGSQKDHWLNVVDFPWWSLKIVYVKLNRLTAHHKMGIMNYLLINKSEIVCKLTSETHFNQSVEPLHSVLCGIINAYQELEVLALYSCYDCAVVSQISSTRWIWKRSKGKKYAEELPDFEYGYCHNYICSVRVVQLYIHWDI